jgi:hypothetical protein
MPSHKGPVRPTEDHPAAARRQQGTAESLTESPLDRARASAAKLRGASPHSHTPPDPGEVLAEAPRGDGSRLRVSWREYEGHPFVTIAVWGADGWPVRGKQVSVRVGELGAVLEALILAAERASGWKP